MRAFRFVGFAMFVLSMSASGCASMRAMAARQDFIRAQTQQFVYRQPLETVWTEARKMLFEYGYAAKTADTGNSFSVETETKLEENAGFSRYLVQGTKLDVAACRVEFTKMRTDQKGNAQSERDIDIEWVLIKRVDPAAAAQIEAAAEAEGHRARGAS